MRRFNTTGPCIPELHYMVDIADRLVQIRAMVERGEYFCINRARQYGKTTTLIALKRFLAEDFEVASLDFQNLSHADFETENTFTRALIDMLLAKNDANALPMPDAIRAKFEEASRAGGKNIRISGVFATISEWCSLADKPIVLIIDEVDSATNNQAFLDFLAQLRAGYIGRIAEGLPAFRSVILAGVTDIRNLRAKIRPEDQHRLNSPWNIAVSFDIDMSLSAEGIAGMLADYESDHATGMDVNALAKAIRSWTNGYPFLVSRICQLLDASAAPSDREAASVWTRNGVEEAAHALLTERNALFDSLTGKLEAYPELKADLRLILMEGERIPYNPDLEPVRELEMHGFVRRSADGRVAVANRIFETRLYELFISEDKTRDNRFLRAGDLAQSAFVKDGRLDMRGVLEGFWRTYTEIFGPLEDRFPEKDGRELFLLYLKPIINGTGNYYIEAQTRDQTRTDVIVDYLGERFVIELKIWRGPRYNEAGERQVAAYLEYFGLDVGYMLSFNFNKKKTPGLSRVDVDGKVLFEETL